MDKTSDNSSYMRMMSESHASSSSPLVYTCSAQPSSFHCMKGYRQLAYDSTAFDSSTAPSYPSIKQEPIDYTTCENPYEQGTLKKIFSPQFSRVYSLIRIIFSNCACIFVTNFLVFLLPKFNKINPYIFRVNLIFFHLKCTLVERNTFVGVYHIFIWFFPPLTNVKIILKPWPPRAF